MIEIVVCAQARLVAKTSKKTGHNLPAVLLLVARVSGCTVGPSFAVSDDIGGRLCCAVDGGGGGVLLGYFRAALGVVVDAILLAVCAAFEVEEPIAK